MKIPFKYGLLITIMVAVWVMIARTLVANPLSLVHTLGSPIVFNVLHFVMLYLGLKALEREKRERPTFKEGLKTGVAISFFYALTISLFFVGVIAFIGPRWLVTEAASSNDPMSQVAARAFAALFLGTMILGLVYSTVIAFFLAKRLSEER